MEAAGATNGRERLRFNALFAADWLLGQQRIEKLMPRRWDKLHQQLLAKASRTGGGRTLAVDRRRGLTPEEFKARYFLPGVPVVLEGAAADWPAIRKWSPEYLLERCGDDEIPVLDAHNWQVNRADGKEAVSTAETTMPVADLLRNMKEGGAWYGAFMELLDQYADLRADLDLSFIETFGHANPRIPWHRNVLAKMYVGGPNTSTSLHCAGISNLYVQVYGRKQWVLIQPVRETVQFPRAHRADARGVCRAGPWLGERHPRQRSGSLPSDADVRRSPQLW